MNRPVPGKTLVIVVGATAVGKTSIAVELAQHYQCSILSADSRQCYRELGVATAKPDSDILKKVQHFFVDSHSIRDPVSAAEFEAYALDILSQIYRQDDYCIMVGGSGLYLKAVSDGLDRVPDIPPNIRQDLEKKLLEQGLDSLVAKLKSLDRDSVETLNLENPRRVIRALEVCLFTGKPYSSFLTGAKKTRPFNTVKIGLRRDRKELYKRIEHRMEEMIEQGLFEEAEHLYRFRNEKPLQTVGYQEIFGYLDGLYDQQEAVRLLKRNSRRYAKRQLTWFGKDPSIRWFQADDLSSILEYLDQTVAAAKS
jgi:tRNA dimethylallyltransferase